VPQSPKVYAVRRKYSQILQHLSEPETLRIIDLARVDIIDIINRGKSSRCLQEFVEAIHSTRRSVEVFRVASHPERVKVGLQNFGTEDVIWGKDIVPVFVIELELVCSWWAVACEVPVG